MFIYIPDIRLPEECTTTENDIRDCVYDNLSYFEEIVTLQENFIWTCNNIHVYEAFADLTIYCIVERGARRLGPNYIVNLLRFGTRLADNDQNALFKLPCKCSSFLSRLFMCLNPQHMGIFETAVKNKLHPDYLGTTKHGCLPARLMK